MHRLSFVVKLLKLWQETGSVTPRPVGGRRHAKLAPYLDWLISEVEAQPDVTMPELGLSWRAGWRLSTR